MRFCVDMKIRGRKSEYIAKTPSKPIKTIKQTIWRAKKRYQCALLNLKHTEPEMVENIGKPEDEEN